MISQNLTDQAVLERIQADVKAEVEAGMQFAINAPYPDQSQVTEDVYA